MKKMTALLFAVVAAAALAVGMVGCGGGAASSAAPEPTPSNAVSGALDALKAQDAEAFAKYYAGEAPESLDIYAELEKEESYAAMPDEQKAMVKAMIDKVLDFDYAVGNEQVDGDKATVDVTFTTYDFGSSVETIMGNIMTMAMSMQTSGAEMDQAAGEAAAVEAMQKALDGLSEKSASATVTVNVTKDAEGNWKVDDLSSLGEDEAKKLGDALLGGLVTKLEGLMGSLGGAFNMDALGEIADDVVSDKAA